MPNRKEYISIFCGSRIGNDPLLRKIAYDFGYLLSTKYNLIYGGTNIGLMNDFANGVLNNKGKIIGIITENFKNSGIMHEGLTKCILVPDMHKRKIEIYKRADYFLVFPGGYGTLDEIFEVITWKQLGLINQPVVIFNYNGFFTTLFNHLENTSMAGFTDSNIYEIVDICQNYDELRHYFL